jgi:hypothetical protein
VDTEHHLLLEADDDILIPSRLCSDSDGGGAGGQCRVTHERGDIDMLLCGMLSIALIVDERGLGVHCDDGVNDPLPGCVTNWIDEPSGVVTRVELVEVKSHEARPLRAPDEVEGRGRRGRGGCRPVKRKEGQEVVEVNPSVRALFQDSAASIRWGCLQVEEAERGLQTILNLNEEVVVWRRIDPTEVVVLSLEVGGQEALSGEGEKVISGESQVRERQQSGKEERRRRRAERWCRVGLKACRRGQVDETEAREWVGTTCVG